MRMRNRSFALSAVAVVAMVSLVLAGCTGGGTTEKPAETKAPYKLGAILSLTGTYAGLGEPEKAAIEMEVERINAAGGVNGHPIEVVIEDDATLEANAVAAAAKLIGQDKVLAILGATGSGQTMAVRGDVDKAGIPQVSMAGATAITAKFDPLVFQTPWSNKIVVPFTMSYLKGAGITKIGLITDSGGFGKDGRAVVQAEAPKAGITLVADETFNPGDADMSAQLTKIKNSGAQAIVMWTAGKEAAIIAKNREQLKMTIPLYGSHGIARKEFIDGAGTAAEGVIFAAGKVLVPESYGKDTENFKVATDFIERFTAKTGKAPSTFAGHAYDALYITVNAMKALPEGFTAADLRNEIEKTQGFVGIGGTFNFTSTDHNGLTDQDLVMYQIKGGTWTVVPQK